MMNIGHERIHSQSPKEDTHIELNDSMCSSSFGVREWMRSHSMCMRSSSRSTLEHTNCAPFPLPSFAAAISVIPL